MKVHNLITDRKSIRAFAERPISSEDMITLLEAARWAPSSMNEQPWRFIIARKENKVAFERMLETLNESNRNWARHAAMLMLTIAHKNFSTKDIPNPYAWHDVGLAIGNLSLQAMSLDIYMHQMGGFKSDVAKELFSIPAGFEPVSVIALGYKGNPDLLPDPLRERELHTRVRKPLSELVYENNFGGKSSFLE